MNAPLGRATRVRPTTDPHRHVRRRLLTMLVVPAAILALGAAAALETLGMPTELVLGSAGLAFVIVAIGGARWLASSPATSSQLGPDAERVISRKTGART